MKKMCMHLFASVRHANVFWILLLCLPWGTAPAQTTEPPTIGEVFRAVSPAIVKVYAYDENNQGVANGSGFIVTAEGLVVTNYHVVRGAHQVKIVTRDGAEFWVAGMIDMNSRLDFAVLKVAGANLPTASLGFTLFVEVGDPVIAIGHPMGQEYSVSDGIISQWRDEDGFQMMQHTASISPGSSGGPLLNRTGEVIGINTSGLREANDMYFALPITYVSASLSEHRRVQWSLPEVARWQREQDHKAFEAHFELHRDDEGLFEMRRPRGWQVQQDGRWNEEETVYTRAFLTAPQEAHRALLHGYLSEGVRVFLELPKRGYTWPDAPGYLPEWSARRMRSILKANPGFAVTDSAEVTVAGQPARMYAFIGENNNITEPEKTTFYFVARPEYRLSIEVVTPVSRYEDNRAQFDYLLGTFGLITPTAPDVATRSGNNACTGFFCGS